MKIYLVRHGETYFNKYDKMQGWSDSPLTQNGIIMAEKCADKLKDISFDMICSSDSGRSIETAEIITARLNHLKDKNLLIMKAFRESFFGGFEGEIGGKAWEKIAKNKGYEKVIDFFSNTPLEEIMDAMKEADEYHDAESFVEFWQRVYSGLKDITTKGELENFENILIVTHGNTIRNIVHQFNKNIDISQNILNTSVTILNYADNKFLVESFND